MNILNEELKNNEENLNILIEKMTQTNELNIKNFEESRKIIIQYAIKISNYPVNNIETNLANKIVFFLRNLKSTLDLTDTFITKLYSFTETLKKLNTQDFESINQANQEFNDIITFSLENMLKIEEFLLQATQFTNLAFNTETNKEENLGKQSETIETITDETSIKNTSSDTNSTTTSPENTTQLEEDVDKSSTQPITEEVTTLSTSQITNEKNHSDLIEENTLIISEISGKVILPYSISELTDILEKSENKYTSIQAIIEDKYTIPYSNYKNPIFARFKETFKLVKSKEKRTIKEAIDLAMELMFNFNIHPAIITACKNVDELDIYLDYLDTNETEKFDLFKIKFEVAPMIK